MGRGLLQNMFSVVWSACVCISLNFPRNRYLFFSVQNQEGGVRQVAESQE